MASVVIRRAWFGRVVPEMKAKVPVSASGVTEAQFLASLAPFLMPGTRNTASGAPVGNVASSVPAAGTTQNAGTAIAYTVNI